MRRRQDEKKTKREEVISLKKGRPALAADPGRLIPLVLPGNRLVLPSDKALNGPICACNI